MVGWSSHLTRIGTNLRNVVAVPKYNRVFNCKGINQIQVRMCKSQGGTFTIVPSNFHWNKTKDMIKLHVILSALPYLLIILYCNIFIGPATLKPIPEDYEPEIWEYYEHPIQRFLAKYLMKNPQKEYEKLMHGYHYIMETKMLRELETKIKFLIAERRDFQAWYHTPALVKYSTHAAQSQKNFTERGLFTSGLPIYK